MPRPPPKKVATPEKLVVVAAATQTPGSRVYNGFDIAVALIMQSACVPHMCVCFVFYLVYSTRP